MLRVVDMKDATSCENTFSIWDTVRDRFIEDECKDQCWDRVEDIDIPDSELIRRIRNLVEAHFSLTT